MPERCSNVRRRNDQPSTPPADYLAVAHPARDIHVSQVTTAVSRANVLMSEPVTMRSHDEVGRFFEGLVLVEPGLVQLHRWRPGPEGPVPDHDTANYGAVARKL